MTKNQQKKKLQRKAAGKRLRLSLALTVLWAAFGVCLVAAGVIFALIANGKIGYMPPIEELENPKNRLATEVYTADGQLLTTYYSETDNRISVDYNQLSPHLVKALLATEDIRFTQHSGIDFKAIFRAVIKRVILRQKSAGGGSTLTQQLAKQLYTPTADNLFERALQKPIEWVIAVQLERCYTKEEILTMYLNKFDFLYNAVGIKTASKVYFNTTPDALTIEQAATLTGMFKNPSYFNPRRYPQRCTERRNLVIDQMNVAGYLTDGVCDSIKALPLVLDYQKVDHTEGLAPYFRQWLRVTMTHSKPDRKRYASWQEQLYRDDSIAWATDPLFGWCHKNKKNDGSDYNLYIDGLKIYTTLDSRMQQYAEEAVHEHIAEDLQPKFFKEKSRKAYAPYTNNLSAREVDSILWLSARQTERYRVMREKGCTQADIKKAFRTPVEMEIFTYHGFVDTMMSPIDSIRYHKHFLRAGFVSMDPYNGHVKAYVGGVSFKPFEYDMVMTGRRQVGSTIKPFLYAMAMEDGFSPCDPVRNEPITLITEAGDAWTPRNSGSKQVGEMVTLKWGLANSNNWISAYLMSKMSPYAFVKMLRSFGVKGHLDPVYSLCLGSCEISLSEMVSAYTAFVNGGIRVAPLCVTRIEDNDGNVISHFSPRMYEVFSQETCYKMETMLRAVINEGTGVRLRFKYGFTADIGGKTGTTQNKSDGWFMGITPRLVSGVWGGGEDRDIHFDFMAEGQGANVALPIWALYMNKVYADTTLGYSQADSFFIPEPYLQACPTLAVDGAGSEAIEEIFDDL